MGKTRGKHVVITGGSGFIGSHLCERLIADGHRITCVDNLITGSMDNIRGLMKKNRLVMKLHDVSRFIDIPDAVDYVLHFASPASPVDYLDFPIQTLKVGSLGTHNALGLAKMKRATFLLASTSEVYGDPLVHPQSEAYWGNVNPVGPRGVYDEAKRFAESLTLAYHRVHGIDAKIVRIFNTYGPRMRRHDGRAIPNFIEQALRGEPLTIYGDGSQTRSFCYVDDLVEGIIRLLHSSLNEPVNMGNPREMTLQELAEEVIRLTGSTSRLVYKPLPVDDPKKRRPDITRAKTRLRWQPRVSLGQGLRKTIAWFRSHGGYRTPVPSR